MKIITYDLPKQVQLPLNTTYTINRIRDISKVSPELAQEIAACLPQFINDYNKDELILALLPVSTLLRNANYDSYSCLFRLRGVNLKDRYNVVDSIIVALKTHKIISFKPF